MKIFKELKKLGYKHYTEHTVEELDNLPLESKERIMEQALVLRWFREKYGLHAEIGIDTDQKVYYFILVKDFKNIGTGVIHEDFTPRTYEEAELACLIKLIEIVKTFNSK